MYLGDVLFARKRHLVTLLHICVLLGGCASLPTNGPTAGGIERHAASKRNTIGYQIIDITPTTLPDESLNPVVQGRLSHLALESGPQRSNVIRKGDMLSISIYEVGVSLFGGAVALENSIAPQIDSPTANAQRMGVQVDDEGKISLPFVGQMQVAGHSPREVEAAIVGRLSGLSQSPQALVTITDSIENSVYVSGAIAKPGRFRLSAVKEKMLDIISLAGGPSVEIEDTELRFVRGTRTATMRLGELHPEDADNIVLAPGDRIEMVKSPRSFTVFGATDKVSQLGFGTRSLYLSEAIARVGGPSDQRANPTRVFLFRFERADGTDERPVIYRLNMMDPQSYFLAQRFAMKDKDLIYFSNSASNPPAKFINLINQLFSPVVTARVLTNKN